MRNGIIICLAVVSSALACAHEAQKTAGAARPGQAGSQNQPLSTGMSPSGSTCSSDGNCGDKQLCIRGQCVDITPDLAECSTIRVHFDFNVAQIHQDDTAKLERIGRCLRADHALHVVIEGNADERGTEEWNLALGDKRATAVETYLERLGASAAQLKTVTYGKDRPLCSEHNESCWAKNRRAALKPKEAR